MSDTWYVDNDNDIDTSNKDGDGFLNPVTGLYLNSATVTGTVRAGESSTSAIITGITQPVTFTYITGSNGRYVGVFDKLLALVANTTYYCHITMVSGSTDAYIIKKIRAKTRVV